MVLNIFYCTLDDDEVNCVSACEIANNVWNTLLIPCEGMSQEKESNISTYLHLYELFKRLSNKGVKDMGIMFTNISFIKLTMYFMNMF